MHRIEAKYFDGQSSVAHKVVLIANEKISELRLQHADGSLPVWYVDDLNFEQYGDCLEIRNRQFSSALLQINDEQFSKQFFEAMKREKKVDIHSRLLSLGFRKIVGIAAVLFGLIVASYIYLLPPIAERSVLFIPQSFDIALGNTFMRTYFNENRVDSAKTKLLQEFAEQIDFENTIPLTFTVVESGLINAFALPNGQIVIYTGLLHRLQSASELAALMAHEAAHINYRHSVKMLTRNLAGYLLISLILSDVNGIMAVLADNANQLHNLSYSRKFEREADAGGLRILKNNHIDPNGKVELFALLEREAGIAIPAIISTHPLTAERKRNMQEIIANSEYKILPQSRLDELFVQMRD
jgi:predicted Zn-dependent protease